MSQWGFYFNQDRCIGCRACELACKNWNDGRRGDAGVNPLEGSEVLIEEGTMEPEATFLDSDTGETNYKSYRRYHMKENWRRVTKYEYGAVIKDPLTGIFSTQFDVMNMSVSCNHCDEPACVDACPMGAYTKDADTGIVLRTGGCLSCGACQDACPWEAPQFYDDLANYKNSDPAKPTATKCTLCYDRIREGLRPACVAACLNRALDAGEISMLKREYLDAVTEVPEFTKDVKGIGMGTRPNIIFKPRTNKAKI